MAIIWENNFDGTDFTSITVANSSAHGDPVASVGGVATYSAVWAAHGTASALLGSGDGSDEGTLQIDGGSGTDWSVRWYCLIPATGWQMVSSANTLTLLDSDLAEWEILGQDVSAHAAQLADRPLRIETSKVGGTVTVRVWWTNPDSPGPHDLQVQDTTTETDLYLHVQGGGFGTPPSYVDEIAIGQGEWIGPVATPIDETGAAHGELVVFGEADGYSSWVGAALGELVVYGQADGRPQGLTPAEGYLVLWGQADGWPGHTGAAHGELVVFGEADGTPAQGDGATGELVLYGHADGFAGASVATGHPVEDMWLGPLGLMHRMRERGQWERTPDLGVSSHVSLHGTVTTSRARRAPRTTTLAWDRLERVDADALEEITLVPARSDGTVAVVDPDAAQGNLLTPEQSRGRPGPGSAPVSVQDLYQVTGPGSMTVGLVNGVRYAVTNNAATGTGVRWLHPYYGVRGWPVMPGWPVYMAAALTGLAAIGRMWLTFYDYAGAVLGSSAGLVGDGQCQADAPPGAATVSPHLILAEGAPGLRLLGEARLSYAPQPDDARPLGNGCPIYSVTSFSDTPALPWRSTTLTLQEVRTHAYR